MRSRNSAINFVKTTVISFCLVFSTTAFAMDDMMMGKMPDPEATDSMQNDPNDTSNSTAGKHNHKKMIKDHENMINEHKMMMKKDARAQMGKMKMKKMPTNDPADKTATPESDMPAGEMEDM